MSSNTTNLGDKAQNAASSAQNAASNAIGGARDGWNANAPKEIREKTYLESAGDAVTGTASSVYNGVTGTATSAYDSVVGTVAPGQKIQPSLGDRAQGAASSAQNAASNAFGGARDNWNANAPKEVSEKTYLESAEDAVTGTASSIYNGVTGTATSAYDSVVGTVAPGQKIEPTLGDRAQGAASSAQNTATDAYNNVAGAAKDATKKN